MSVNQADAESLLGGIRDMLRADGYDLVVQADHESVKISVVATESACAECLVPSELMTEIIRDSLVEGSGGRFSGQVSVQYPRSGPNGSSH
jgi:hypothetical protein